MADLKPLRPFARWLGRQRWIRFGIRDRVARAAENPDTTSSHHFQQFFFGGVYAGSTGNFIDWSARYFGAYAIEELDLIADIVGSTADFQAAIDIGANVGNHALRIGLMGGRVVAFEPNPQAMLLLQQKIRVNPNVNVLAVRRGLSDRQGQLLLSLPNHCNLGTASFEKKVGTRSIDVDICRGDEADEIKALSRLDFVKIDVEGHELKVLAGLQKTLATYCPSVFFEWQGGSLADVKSLFPNGYSFYRFLGDQTLAFFFAKPGYRLQPLPARAAPKLCNILAWPSTPLPACLAPRLCRSNFSA